MKNKKQFLLLKPYCRFSGYTIPTPTPTLLLLFDCQKEKLTQTYAGKRIFVFLLPILGSLAGTLQIRLTKDRLTRENKQRLINKYITDLGEPGEIIKYLSKEQ